MIVDASISLDRFNHHVCPETLNSEANFFQRSFSEAGSGFPAPEAGVLHRRGVKMRSEGGRARTGICCLNRERNVLRTAESAAGGAPGLGEEKQSGIKVAWGARWEGWGAEPGLRGAVSTPDSGGSSARLTSEPRKGRVLQEGRKDARR